MPNEVQVNSANFQKNISSYFQELRHQPDFSDVTLVSEDKQRFKVHRVILLCGSGFFKTILEDFRNDFQPLIYLRGVQAKTLTHILDFLYHGSAKLMKEDVDDFLSFASELEVNGLSVRDQIPAGQTNAEEEQAKKIKTEVDGESKMFGEINALENISTEATEMIVSEVIQDSTKQPALDRSDGTPVIVRFREKNEDLRQKILSMIVKIEQGWSCLGCHKISARKPSLMKHVEIHIDGFSHPCDHCDKKFKNSNSLQYHMSSSLYCIRAQSMID